MELGITQPCIDLVISSKDLSNGEQFVEVTHGGPNDAELNGVHFFLSDAMVRCQLEAGSMVFPGSAGMSIRPDDCFISIMFRT